jgi:hypothetical protein
MRRHYYNLYLVNAHKILHWHNKLKIRLKKVIIYVSNNSMKDKLIVKLLY